MMYGFLTTGDTVPDAMPGILATAFSVQAPETDVSDSSEWESRNWDAVVTCEYDRLEGDLHWSLTIYAAEEVEQQPSEEQLAVLLSRELGVPVFFTWGDELPWIRKVARPEGRITLARVAELEDQRPGFTVTAMESAVAGFPDVPVAHFPEIVRALDIPTPVTDGAIPAGSGREFETIRGLLVNWERLCSRMRNSWPPAGWYSAAMYQEDLELRDKLDVCLGGLPNVERLKIEKHLSALDAQYREMSVEDGGSALSAALGREVAAVSSRPWYWHRRPAVLPRCGQ